MTEIKSTERLMRDAFIDTVFQAAKADRDLYFLSADFGAAALDAFRRDLPEQFIHTGICEQNMVDLGAGLAIAGKRVMLYAMAPFITARCYEQIKAVLVSMRLPVTLIAVGVGLGYDHATMTHFTPEDVAAMRALNGMEVLSPCDAEAAEALARDLIARPRLSYVRLERQGMAPAYNGTFAALKVDGLATLAEGKDVVIVACGYLTHKALKAREQLATAGISAAVIDLFRIKPLNGAELVRRLAMYPAVVTVEEQLLDGGFGGAVLEAMADAGLSRPVRRLGLRDGFEVVNGSRDHLHHLYGIDTPYIVAAAAGLASGQG
ncbi:1-deoxy-D-xylulose-5-phosphate synthase [uncultured Gammaproteobacteria bacterium]